jgi:hypothetical protein
MDVRVSVSLLDLLFIIEWVHPQVRGYG